MTRLVMRLLNGQVLYFTAGIVDGYVPSLIRLDVMPQQGLILDFYSSPMRTGQYEWTVPMKYFKGHIMWLYIKPALQFACTHINIDILHGWNLIQSAMHSFLS